MSTRIVQRAIVAVLAIAALGAAIAVHITSTQRLHDRRVNRLETARHRVADALQRRTYFLEDLADMVGVHDDAAAAEFSRYAHVRGREERAIVSVQWARRSPNGRLVPPADPDPNPGPTPVLIAPAVQANRALADAAREQAAAHVIRLASLGKAVSVSAPVALSNGHRVFYLGVPVQARAYSGLLSKAESQSAIVGLVDAQTLVGEALGGGSLAFRLRDSVTPLATIGSGLHNAVHAAMPADGRQWVIVVEGGSLTPIQVALPWLILIFGFSLATAVAVVLRNAARRRDEALRLADERLADLTVSLQRVELVNQQLEVAHAEDTMLELAERARRALSDEPIVVDGIFFQLRVSIGAVLTGGGLDTPDAAVDAADQALYDAKRAGRDCVRVYMPPTCAAERADPR